MVASIIAAAERKEGGMVGLAPRCKVVTASQGTIEHTILKLQRNFFQANPKATLAQWQAEMARNDATLKQFGTDWVRYQYAGSAEAIRYLVDRGVRVINISGGLWRSGCPDDEAWDKLEAAFAYAATKDVVIVLGAGNDALDRSDYPGNAQAVLIVGATNLNDTRWEQEFNTGNGKLKQGSSYGRRLSVMAPAENVVVCQPHDPRFYKCDDGPIGQAANKFDGAYMTRPHGATSCAAPVVTSLVALVFSVRPDLDAPAVVSVVQQGCDDLQEPGFDTLTGFGRVNFAKTLQIAAKWARQ
jgi:subtilisin family serine protease